MTPGPSIKHVDPATIADPLRVGYEYTPSTPGWLAPVRDWVGSGVPDEVLRRVARCPVEDAPVPPCEFGAAARASHFCLEEGTAYLNHGSYGACYKMAFDAQSWCGWCILFQLDLI